MCFILKERVCPLLIKLFSPSTKLKLNSSTAPSSSTPATTVATSSSFPIVSRLIRIVYVLIKSYFELLVTESEIFLSLLAKFLDMSHPVGGGGGGERPVWQKALVIECLHKIALEPRLVQLICAHYDMQPHPEKIFHLMCNGIALFIQSLFLSAAMSNPGTGSGGGGAQSGSSGSGGGAGSGSTQSAQSTMSSISSGAQSGSGGGSSQTAGASGSTGSGQQQPSFAFQVYKVLMLIL